MLLETGLSSLLIIENIMEKIRDKNGLSNAPRPCESFDLIGGTLDIPTSSSPLFSAVRLENAMKSVIRSFCVEAECKSRRDQGQSTAGLCPHEDMLFRDKTCTRTYASNYRRKTE